MRSSIDQFLRRFVVRKRIVALMFTWACGSSVAIGSIMTLVLMDRWLTLGAGIRVTGLIVILIVVLAIVLPQLWWAFRRFDPVTSAIEIEQILPVFDQRLITVASQQVDSQLVNQLRIEVETIIADTKIGSLISLRSLWMTVIVLAVLIVLLIGFSNRLPLRRFYWPKIYSPLPASSKMNSTSTAASRGKVFTPTAARA